MPLSCSSSPTGVAPMAASHSAEDERGPRASTTRSASCPSTPTTRWIAPGPLQRGSGDAVAERDARFGQHELAQHPFERRALGMRSCTVLRRPAADRVGKGRRQILGELDLRCPGASSASSTSGARSRSRLRSRARNVCECRTCGAPVRCQANASSGLAGIGVSSRSRTVTSCPSWAVGQGGSEPRDPAAHDDDPHRTSRRALRTPREFRPGYCPDPTTTSRACARNRGAAWAARCVTVRGIVEAEPDLIAGGFSGKWQATWCSPRPHQRRLLGRADLLRLPAAGAEPAARRRVQRAGHVARAAGSARARRRGVGSGTGTADSSASRVRVPRPLVERRPRSPISTILPRYITATRSQMCRTTDRSCAMNR